MEEREGITKREDGHLWSFEQTSLQSTQERGSLAQGLVSSSGVEAPFRRADCSGVNGSLLPGNRPFVGIEATDSMDWLLRVET